MKRFLSTTAILVAMSGAAFADAHMSGFGSVKAEQGDFFASDLIGMRIYNSEIDFDADSRVADGAETEWDDIGEINDLIVNQNGDVTAVILGVGGFLGLGERDVSVSMDAIKVVREEGDSNDRFLVVKTSKEALEAAPEFDRAMKRDMDQTAETAEVKADGMANNTAMERTMLTRPQVKRDGYADIDVSMLTADKLEGARIYGIEDEDIGEIETLIVDDGGKITHVLADIGGFLGMGEHTVKLSFDELQIVRKGDADDFFIYVDSTEDQLKNLPEHSE